MLYFRQPVIKSPYPIYENYDYLYFYPPYAYYKAWKHYKCYWCKHNKYNQPIWYYRQGFFRR